MENYGVYCLQINTIFKASVQRISYGTASRPISRYNFQLLIRYKIMISFKIL